MKYRAPLSLAAYLGCIREASRKVASATRMLRRPRFSDGGSIRNIQIYQIEPGTIHQGRAGYIVLQASHGNGALRILEEQARTGIGGAPQESTRQCRSALYVRVRRGRSSARRSISTVRPIHTKTIPERYSSSTVRAKYSPTILTEKFVMRAPSYVQLGSDENGAKLRLR
jgi:hypothetical protein